MDPNKVEPLNLEKLRLKTAGQLKDNERTFIKEHAAELTDEDKEAYSVFLDTAPDAGGGEGQPSAGAADAGASAGSGGDAGGGGNEGGNPAANGTPSEAQPAYVFKTEEEAQNFVKKQIAQDKQAAIDAAATPAEKKWVEDNWKPKDWNQGIQTAAEAAVAIMEEKQKKAAEAADAHNKRVEADWQALRTEAKLNDIKNDDGTVNTDALKVHDAIVEIGTKFGKKNFKDAYEVYMMVPTDKGGGYVVTPGETPPPTPSEAGAALAKQKADKIAAQKKAAAKLGGQNPGSAAQGGGGAGFKPAYEDLKLSRSKLIKRALAA